MLNISNSTAVQHRLLLSVSFIGVESSRRCHGGAGGGVGSPGGGEGGGGGGEGGGGWSPGGPK